MSAARPPFDTADGAQAAVNLPTRGLAVVDPFTAAQASDDGIFTTSLSGVCFLMAHNFGPCGRTALGQRLRGRGRRLAALRPRHRPRHAAFETSVFVFAQASLFREIGVAAGERSPGLPPCLQLAFWMADRLRARHAGWRGGRDRADPAGSRAASRGASPDAADAALQRARAIRVLRIPDD